MSECPVCQTEYIEGDVNRCSACSWDLTPYPPSLAQPLPSEFLEQEQAKLAWARQMWAKLQSDHNVSDASYNLGGQLAEIHGQLKEAKQERSQIRAELQQLRTQLEVR